MRHLKNYESFKTNEEISGIAILAGVGLAFAASAIYDKAKQMWSKHVTSSKYEKTGNTEEVVTANGKMQLIEEYKGKDGKIYWGYDHLWSPDNYSDPEEAKASLDLYTAIFNEEDLGRLVKFLKGIKVKTSITGSDGRFKPSPEYDYLDKPKAVDMIFREDVDHGHMGY